MLIIPSINKTYQHMGKTIVFPKEYSLVTNNTWDFSTFISRMEKIGKRLDTNAHYKIYLEMANTIEDEAYILDISNERIYLYASTINGFYNGLTSIYQIIAFKSGKIKPCVIEDTPKYKYRGFMLDSARHFIKKDEILKIIEQASLVKMNYFHWYLSDDTGYRIESKIYPELNKIGSYRKLSKYDPLVKNKAMEVNDRYGGFYSFDDIKEIVNFAKLRGIEVIPEIDIPGHSSALIASYNFLSCKGKKIDVKNQFGIFKSVLCPGKDSTYTFIKNLLKEIMDLFESKYIHIGGDETSYIEWKNCEDCNRVIKENNLNSYDELQTYFMNDIIDFISKNNKIAICFNESIRSHKLDKRAIVQYWMEMNTNKSYSKAEIKDGRKFIMSNMNNFYMDYSYNEIPLTSILNYKPEMKGYSVNEKCVLGIEACLWTEWLITNDQIEAQIYPRLLAVAEKCWAGSINGKDFLDKCDKFLNNSNLSILKPKPMSDLKKSKEKCIIEIVKSMRELSSRYHIASEDIDEDNVTFIENKNDNADQLELIRSFFEEKMKYAYSKKDIEYAVSLVINGGKN